MIGLSFGGLIAIEIAKQIETEKVILIASAKTKYEIPFYYRFAGKLRLHRLLPTSRVLKNSNFITNWFFGAKSKSDKRLLKQILADTDATFLRWALDKIVRWKNKSQPQNVFHIHGTRDMILPSCFVRYNYAVNGGGHLMTLNKAEELSKVIQLQL